MPEENQNQPGVQAYLVAFRQFAVTDDGEHVVFQVADTSGGMGNLAVPWNELSKLAHMLNQAGVEAAQKRLSLGKSDDFAGVGSAQIVSKFAVNDVPEKNLRILSFTSPSGLRSDFAISHEQKDQSGRSFPHAMAAALAAGLKA